MSTTTKSPTQIVIGPVRLSFLNVWEVSPKYKKYGASIIISKKDKANLTKVKEAEAAAIVEAKAKWGTIPKKFKTPLRDGDEEKEDPAYENSFFLGATSKNQPNVLDTNKEKMLDKDELYSGCYAYVSLTFKPFDFEGSKGISCYLNNILKAKDGEKLSGGSSAESDFAAVEVSDDDDFMN